MKLKIVEESTDRPREDASKKSKEEARAHYERLWLQKGASLKSALEKERLQRSLHLLLQFTDPQEKKACDLGCGEGSFAKILEQKGAFVDAVDISKNALKHLTESENIRPIHDSLPQTKLEDSAYDIVAALDLIAELPKNQQRLLFMELARLVKKQGFVLVSTPIDFRSENALELFLELSKTELELKGIRLSYHRYFIGLIDVLKGPNRFHQASLDEAYRQRSLKKRTGIARAWFSVNSKKILGTLWGFFSKLTNPLYKWARESEGMLNFLEKSAKAISGDHALTHAIIIGIRKPLFTLQDHPDEAIERKTKKSIWE